MIIEDGLPCLRQNHYLDNEPPKRIVLEGGFPSLAENPRFPLSPSLHLNASLSTLSNEQILKIALAEEERLARCRVQSYQVEIKASAAVISQGKVELSEFLDTWGGMIQNVPVLLSDNQQHDFTPADRVTVKNGGSRGSLVVHVEARSPVDREKCTMCGLCGSFCDAVAPGPLFDFSKCNFCGECAGACPEEAIDIHAVSEIKFETPAVILVGNPGVSMPAGQENIFHTHEGMDAFAARVGVYSVEERISLSHSLCQYIARLDTGCRRCLDACGTGALEKNHEGIVTDHFKCSDCGRCVAACPSGAIQHEALDDAAFINWFGRAELPRGVTLVLGSEESLLNLWWKAGGRRIENAVFMEHPSIGSLSLFHYLFIFSLGIGGVVLLEEEEIHDGQAAGQRQHVAASRVVATLFDRDGYFRFMQPDEFSSMSCFNGTEPFTCESYSDFSFSSRRRKLVSILQFLFECSDSRGITLAGPGFESFGLIKCRDDRCTACLACLNVCTQGALFADPGNFRLMHDPSLCIQCGACAEICPEDALEMVPGLVTEPDFFKVRVLKETDPVVCRGCGTKFGTGESLRHVTSVLEARGMLDHSGDLLEYCETCRAQRVFEAGAQGEDRRGK